MLINTGNKRMGRENRERGFTLTEVILSLAVTMLVLSGIFLFFTSLNASIENSRKRANLIRLADGIKKSAKFIIEVYTPYCTTNITNSAFGWGWKHPNCSGVRIFPVLSGNTLTFEFNEGILSQQDRNRLKYGIASFFDFCRVDVSQVNKVIVTCSEFDAIYYCRGDVSNCNSLSNLVTVVHVPGQSYDYVANRVVALVVEYTEVGRLGKGGIVHRVGNTDPFSPAILDFGDFYQEMDQKNYKKFIDIYNALKRYEVTKRVLEMKNTAPTGLDEINDYFIPWVYQITANSETNAYAICNDSNGNCANLQSNSYWNRGIGATDMLSFMRNIVNYLLRDNSYFVDAWGNPIGVEILANPQNCRLLYPGSSINCIRISNPPYPQKNYDTLFPHRPPFVGFIYSEFCWDLNNISQSVCRLPIVYAN